MNVKINTHSGPMPEVHGDWIDLYTAEDVHMEPMEIKLISLGVSMELPEGYYAELLPRSSTPKKYGVIMANSMGIIDHDYCGDNDIRKLATLAVHEALNTKGTRLCQYRIVKCAEPLEFIQVEALNNGDRGGFGSTGTN